MIATSHIIALVCYVGAAVLAVAPFARPVDASLYRVSTVLSLGVAAHICGLAMLGVQAGAVPITGLGPALSFSGLVLAATLLAVEWSAREVTLSILVAPLAALPTLCALIIGLRPGPTAAGLRGVWLLAHIALSFLGIAAFGTGAAAGAMYLVQRHELKAHRFERLFRVFPPLATLDRVNHVGTIMGWLGLTVGVVLAAGYSVEYRELNLPQLTWGVAVWLSAGGVALGRVAGGWQARRAALYSSIAFAAVLLLYVAFRATTTNGGRFL